jgi:hypothetical protein
VQKLEVVEDPNADIPNAELWWPVVLADKVL